MCSSNISYFLVTAYMKQLLVKAPVRVHYGKNCTRHAPSVIFPVMHERNWCFYWFIVCSFHLSMRCYVSACAFLIAT